MFTISIYFKPMLAILPYNTRKKGKKTAAAPGTPFFSPYILYPVAYTRFYRSPFYISDDTKEIRKEITDVKVKVNDLSERVVMVEQSTKSAHHRLDRYEEEEIYHGKPRKRWWV